MKMFNWYHELIFQLKFYFKKRKLLKLDPYIYEMEKKDDERPLDLHKKDLKILLPVCLRKMMNLD